MSNSAQKELFMAIDANDAERVKRALKEGANPDLTEQGVLPVGKNKHQKNFTASCRAVKRAVNDDRFEVVLALKDHGINMIHLIREEAGYPHKIVEESSLKLFEFIIDYYPGLYGEFDTTFGIPAVVEAGKVEKLKALIKREFDINGRDEYERTPLMYSRDHSCSHVLIEAGADLMAKDNDGNTPTWHIVQIMLEKALYRVDGTKYVEIADTFTLMDIADVLGIHNDIHAVSLAKQIQERLDGGLRIEDIDDPLLSKSLGQIRAILAQDRMNELSQHLVNVQYNESEPKKNRQPKI